MAPAFCIWQACWPSGAHWSRCLVCGRQTSARACSVLEREQVVSVEELKLEDRELANFAPLLSAFVHPNRREDILHTLCVCPLAASPPSLSQLCRPVSLARSPFPSPSKLAARMQEAPLQTRSLATGRQHFQVATVRSSLLAAADCPQWASFAASK